MSEAGDIYLVDLNEERRRRVLVVSNSRFNRAAERVLVAPELGGGPDDVPFPWRVSIDDTVFAIDFVRSIPTARLLERTDRAPHALMQAVRRALLNLT